jgi:hypothetical protein
VVQPLSHYGRRLQPDSPVFSENPDRTDTTTVEMAWTAGCLRSFCRSRVRTWVGAVCRMCQCSNHSLFMGIVVMLAIRVCVGYWRRQGRHGAFAKYAASRASPRLPLHSPRSLTIRAICGAIPAASTLSQYTPAGAGRPSQSRRPSQRSRCVPASSGPSANRAT